MIGLVVWLIQKIATKLVMDEIFFQIRNRGYVQKLCHNLIRFAALQYPKEDRQLFFENTVPNTEELLSDNRMLAAMGNSLSIIWNTKWSLHFLFVLILIINTIGWILTYIGGNFTQQPLENMLITFFGIIVFSYLLYEMYYKIYRRTTISTVWLRIVWFLFLKRYFYKNCPRLKLSFQQLNNILYHLNSRGLQMVRTFDYISCLIFLTFWFIVPIPVTLTLSFSCLIMSISTLQFEKINTKILSL